MDVLRDVKRREIQLDALSSFLVVAVSVTVGLLLYFLASAGLNLPAFAPLSGYVPRVLLLGLVCALLLYLTDQRRHVHAEVSRVVLESEKARAQLQTTCAWLEFSRDAGSMLATEGVDSALPRVLRQAAALLNANAAALVSEDEEPVFVSAGVARPEAERALTLAALSAASGHAPQQLDAADTGGGQAIALPLRVADDLRFVLCMWRQAGSFDSDEVQALGMIAQTIESAMESEESLAEVQAQLEYLVTEKRPDYTRHSVHVGELAALIGKKLGLRRQFRKNLRLAGLVHDSGMMSLPHDFGNSDRPLSDKDRALVRDHPRIGAELAKAARFDTVVQEAVGGHHERLDGSGYPQGLVGDEIPLAARILAVCEVYDSMSNRSYHGSPTTHADAIAELQSHAGTLYDRSVVLALASVLEESGGTATRPSADVG